ncbi:hypothetical protein PI124_g23334, partial [Phytophthora idaei]
MDIGDKFKEKRSEATSDALNLRRSGDQVPVQIEAFPSDLPVQHPYEMAKFYVCECRL